MSSSCRIKTSVIKLRVLRLSVYLFTIVICLSDAISEKQNLQFIKTWWAWPHTFKCTQINAFCFYLWWVSCCSTNRNWQKEHELRFCKSIVGLIVNIKLQSSLFHGKLSRHWSFWKFLFNRVPKQFCCPQVLRFLFKVKLAFWILCFPCVFYCEVLSGYMTFYWYCSALLRSQGPSETPRFHHKEDYNRFMVHRKWVMKCFLLGIVLTENLSWKFGVGRKEHSRLNEQIIFLSRDFSHKLSLPWRVIDLLLGLWITSKTKRIKRKIKNIYIKESKELNPFFILSAMSVVRESPGVAM